jgi:segregation and condensation protein A
VHYEKASEKDPQVLHLSAGNKKTPLEVMDVPVEYEVKLEIFEGPLDLLLHLIRKNEVDIFDIPIATITDQYLAYLEMMKAFNISIAGDFLLMASTLMHIKSRMLLPDTVDEEEGDDPRLELTRPLLEYMRFKEMAGELSEREVLGRDVFARKPSDEMEELTKGESVPLEANLFQLIDAFQRIISQRLPGAQLKFRLEQWSMNEKIESIISRLKDRRELYFRELFAKDMTVSELVVTFLALLELVHRGLIKVFQSAFDKDIRLKAVFSNERK